MNGVGHLSLTSSVKVASTGGMNGKSSRSVESALLVHFHASKTHDGRIIEEDRLVLSLVLTSKDLGWPA